MANVTIQDLQNDFKLFVLYVWKVLGLPSPTPIQLAIADELQYSDENLILLAFRGVAKSWLTSAYVLWRLWKDRQLEILVVSASSTRSTEFANFVRRVMAEAPLLREMQPDRSKGLRDSILSFDVNGKKPSHAPSVKAVGITGQITGSRADIIIADDVEITNNSYSVEQRKKLLHNVGELTNVLKPTGRLIFLGTPQTEDSIYNKLIATGTFVTRIFPAIYPSDPSIYEDRFGNNLLAPWVLKQMEEHPELIGHATEPTRFPDELLEVRRATIGNKDFALQYLIDLSLSQISGYPLKMRDTIIAHVDINEAPLSISWGPTHSNKITDVETLGHENDSIHWAAQMADTRMPYDFKIMAIDPSGKGSDETAYAIIGYAGGKIYLLDWGGFLEGYSDAVLKELAKKAKTYDVTKIVTEANFGQGMFEKLLLPYLREADVQANLETVTSRTRKQERIIQTLEPLFLQHKIVINYTPLYEEYMAFKNGNLELYYTLQYQITHIDYSKDSIPHDDRIDALALACSQVIERLGLSEQEERQRYEERWLEEQLRRWEMFVDKKKRPADMRDRFIRYW